MFTDVDERQLSRSKTVKGQQFKFITDAVHGFVSIEDAKGRPLEGHASGQFTTMGRAEHALELYLNDLDGKVKRDNAAKKVQQA